MKRIRCAGLVKIDGKFAFMHRTNVEKSKDDPNKPYGEYYVFPGGGLEGEESMFEATERELLEEMGIKVKAKKELYYKEGKQDEYIFECEYISGKFGTGTGPEFSNDPAYKDRGNFLPELISPEDVEKIRLIPIEFKEQLIQDIANKKI
jgi:8-oxo-dGTP pyrophosphatase MutT (NUDIX family)